ncbi:MAG TPA: hypothetical protein VHU91_11165 [Mycobacteriales bacterium]|jgi:hypothetical protein|nr:hypothetical protein [Mycobacteriales bacterium]
MSDPLMPAARRFPVNARQLPLSAELPSGDRPFVLRHARPSAAVEAKHRTPKSQVPHSQNTHLDSKVVKDTYFTPDE